MIINAKETDALHISMVFLVFLNINILVMNVINISVKIVPAIYSCKDI
jgi:hypothetical protein